MNWNRRLATMVALAIFVPAGASAQTSADAAERDEYRRTFDLGRDAQVSVSGLSGTIEVTTHKAPTVDVLVARVAASREELDCGRPLVERSGSRLTIRGPESLASGFDGRTTQHRVVLSLPPSASLLLESITGRVTIEPLQGSLVLRNLRDPERVRHHERSHPPAAVLAKTNALWAGPSALVLSVAKQSGPIRISNIDGDIRFSVLKSARLDFSISNHQGAVSVAGIGPVVVPRGGNATVFREPNGSLVDLSNITGLVQLTRVK
jgi:hypothetical protein